MGDGTPQAEWATEAETAHHEAGHHVAFRQLRPEAAAMDGGEISIIPNRAAGSVGHHATDEVGPRPRPSESTGTFDRREVEDYIVEVYAGGAAGLRFDPRSRSALWHLSDPTPEEEQEAKESGPFALGGSDRYTAEAWLACLSPDRGERAVLRTELRARAVRLVAEHWGEIRALATALIERKRIDAVEAGRIVRTAAGDGGAATDLDRGRGR